MREEQLDSLKRIADGVQQVWFAYFGYCLRRVGADHSVCFAFL